MASKEAAPQYIGEPAPSALAATVKPAKTRPANAEPRPHSHTIAALRSDGRILPCSVDRCAPRPAARGIAANATHGRQPERLGSGTRRRRPANPPNPGQSMPTRSSPEASCAVLQATATTTGVNARAIVALFGLMCLVEISAATAGPAITRAVPKAITPPRSERAIRRERVRERARPAQTANAAAANAHPRACDPRVDAVDGTAPSSSHRLPFSAQSTPKSP